MAGLVGGPGGGAEPPSDAGEFSKIFKKFLKKIVKMHYFAYFSPKNLKIMRYFSLVWTKNTIGWGKY